MNEDNLDDIIIPPPIEFADIQQINNVINSYVTNKDGPPESNPIQYIIVDKDIIIN